MKREALKRFHPHRMATKSDAGKFDKGGMRSTRGKGRQKRGRTR